MRLYINKKSPVGLNEQDKDKNFSTQMQRVSRAFRGAPKTMLQVSIETGILRANICRYVAEMKKQNTIFIIKKGTCLISNRSGVQFLSTNLNYLSYEK